MNKAQFNVKEEDVANRLGLTRDQVRELRAGNLYQDEDFGKVGREICYTEAAVEKIRELLKKTAPGVRLGDLAPMKVAAPKTPASAPTVMLDAVVVRIYPHNPQYLEALLGGQLITIRVANNSKFTRDMVIESRLLVMKNARMFDFVGRCPRARGKW
jgi:hypothetical protein